MFDIIVAIDKNHVIGVREYGEHGLAWPIVREDMRYFRQMTSGCACIVGYNTLLTLPKTFETNRKLIIVNKSFDDALTRAYETGMPVMVIGGASVYEMALKHNDLRTIWLTRIMTSWPSENKVDKIIQFPYHLEQGRVLRESYDSQTNIHMVFEEITTRPTRLVDRYVHQYTPIKSDPYYELVRRIMNTGVDKQGRNGTTRSVFGHQMVFDLKEGYPINVMKRSYPKAIFEELMWMIRGQTDVGILQSKGVSVWNDNSTKEFLEKRGLSYEEGDIGPGYGFQFRHAGEKYVSAKTKYEGVDQLQNVIHLIKNDPSSRRMVINLWDSTMIDEMALPPCHMVYQFGVTNGRLDCHLFQRSWDVMLGWNTATAALLTYLLAHHCNLEPGVLVHSITDCHIYHAHFDGAKRLLQRDPRPYPKLTINRRCEIEDYEFTDLSIEGYLPCPPIRMNMIA